MSLSHNWTTVQPNQKWTVLGKQKRFALWAVYTSIGCMMMGFDWGIAGTATAFPAFQKVMGKPYPSQPSGYLIAASIQSAWSGVGTGGDLIGVAISGQLMELIGRKHTIIIGTILTAVGIGVQIGSKGPDAWKIFLAGRLINAMGFGMTFIISPVWIGENVRPELRGLFLCLQNGSIVFGQFVLSLVAYGTQNLAGKWSYETLIILQFTFVLALALGYPFFPESPYFLLKNRKDEIAARKALRRVHGPNDEGLIDAEVARMKEMIAATSLLAAQAGQNGHPLLQIWKGTNLKRTVIALLGPTAQQFIGAAFVLGYITYFLSLLGIQEYFKASVALYCIMLASNISAFPLIETVGRRPLLVYGIIALTVTELIMGIMGTIMNSAALWVILVCIFLWAIFYQCSLGAVGFALAAEVPSAPLRPTTISVATILGGLAGWLIGFVSPYMINPDAGDLGAKVGFVFTGFGVPLCFLFWFLIPETLGLEFEDIDAMFVDKVNPRHFKREAAVLHHVVVTDLHESENFKAPVATTVQSESV